MHTNKYIVEYRDATTCANVLNWHQLLIKACSKLVLLNAGRWHELGPTPDWPPRSRDAVHRPCFIGAAAPFFFPCRAARVVWPLFSPEEDEEERRWKEVKEQAGEAGLASSNLSIACPNELVSRRNYRVQSAGTLTDAPDKNLRLRPFSPCPSAFQWVKHRHINNEIRLSRPTLWRI